MFTVPPATPGQPSLTLARLAFAFGFGTIDPSKSVVIAAIGDDSNKEVLAFTQVDQYAFALVFDRLYPGLLKDQALYHFIQSSPKPDNVDMVDKPPVRQSIEQMKTAINLLFAMVKPLRGTPLTIKAMQDDPEQVVIIKEPWLDGDCNLTFKVDVGGREEVVNLNEISDPG